MMAATGVALETARNQARGEKLDPVEGLGIAR
jgi:hypothetical protein